MRLDLDAVEARCRSYLEDPAQGTIHGFGEVDKARGALNDPAFWLYLAQPTSHLSSRMKRRLNGQRAAMLTVADLSASAWTIIRGLPQDDAGSRAPSIATTEPTLPAEPSLAAADLASPPSAIVSDPEPKREVQQEEDTFSALPFPGNLDDDEYESAVKDGLGDDHRVDDLDHVDDNDGSYGDFDGDDGGARA
jgi:hypothetical protein